jgi:hypothetical protein
LSISLKNTKEGQLVDPAPVNTDYTNIATASNNIDKDFIRTGGINRAHLAPAMSYGPALIWYAKQEEATGATGTYNLFAYTAITHGVDMEITANQTIKAGDTLRIQGNVFMTDGFIGEPVTAGEFKLAFFWDIGAGFGIINSMEYRYSFLARDQGVAGESAYKNRRLGFSHIYIHSGADIALAKLQCRVSVADPLNTVTFRETSMLAMLQRH